MDGFGLYLGILPQTRIDEPTLQPCDLYPKTPLKSRIWDRLGRRSHGRTVTVPEAHGYTATVLTDFRDCCDCRGSMGTAIEYGIPATHCLLMFRN